MSLISSEETADVSTVALTTLRRLTIFGFLSLGMLLACLDTTIVSTAIPRISEDFDALSSATWIATSYLLTTTALQPLYGRLSDTFGRLPMLILSLLVFIAGSAACGWAPSMGVVIFGRALQGVGGAGLLALVFVIIADITTEQQRPIYMGVLGAVYSIASVIGPLLGGVFADKVTWRWAFLINLPVAGAVLIAVVLFVRLPQPKGSFMEKLRKVDFLGSLVLVGAVVMLLLALTWGGKTHPWSSARIICLLVFSLLAFVLFMLVEWKTTAAPTVPIHLFRIRNVWLSVAGQFFIGLALFVPIFFLPIWYTIVKHTSAMMAGIHVLPYLLSLSVSSMASGYIVSKTGRYRELVIAGTALFVVGCGLMILLDQDISTSKQIAFMFLMGFGMGFNIQTLLIVVQVASSTKDMAASTTLFLFSRSLGSSIGIAVMQSIMQNKLLPGLVKLAKEYPRYSTIIMASLNDQARIWQTNAYIRNNVIDLYVEALRWVWIANVPFAAVGLLFTLPLKHIPFKKS